jgi:hypothetical protein
MYNQSQLTFVPASMDHEDLGSAAMWVGPFHVKVESYMPLLPFRVRARDQSSWPAESEQQ